LRRLFLAPTKPENEAKRLEDLRARNILDTAPEQHYDELTELALGLFNVPIAQISLIDEDRQFIKSSAGAPRMDIARELTFCTHTVSGGEPLIVLDTLKDARFRSNPFVLGDPKVRFYAGVPVIAGDRSSIGTFCLIDYEPRSSFSGAELRRLKSLASLAAELIEGRLLSQRVIEAERKLQQAHERFILATQANADALWEMDYSTGEMHSSQSLKELLGIVAHSDESSISEWFERVHPGDVTRLSALWKKIQRLRELYFETEMRCLHEDGSWRWILIRAVCQRSVSGKLLRVIGSTSDITSKKFTDPLTGLHNRNSLIDQLQRRIDLANQQPRNFALYFLDLDSFKRVTDSIGHANGDSLLIQVASRLEATVLQTPGSLAARLGGDEFVLLVSDLATVEDALTFAALLEHLMVAPFQCGGQNTHLSASIGVVFGSQQYEMKAERMLEEADIAMSKAKAEARGRSILFQTHMKAAAVERMAAERELRRAIDQQQFELYYQPKVELSSGRLCGLEALLRWHHPVRGLLAANQFIPLAEETGLIHLIGNWVADKAISQISSWIARGIVGPETTMAINISAKQIRRVGLWENLITLCRASGLRHENLIVEITESVFIDDPDRVADLLREGTVHGFGLDLDDFGTGYSSLSYLHQFPFLNVKIDRSFVGGMMTNTKSHSLVASVIGLAQSLHMGVIAEGVETCEQSVRLQQLGCKTGQGYLFARALSASRVEKNWGESLTRVS
jgi:diguanylate cyclase (GGDEF)-like protein